MVEYQKLHGSGVERKKRISWNDGEVIVQTSVDLDRRELEKQI